MFHLIAYVWILKNIGKILVLVDNVDLAQKHLILTVPCGDYNKLGKFQLRLKNNGYFVVFQEKKILILVQIEIHSFKK